MLKLGSPISQAPGVGRWNGYSLPVLALIGALHAVWLCGPTLWAADSPFWAYPPGDIATGVIGAEAFLRDSWRWPLAATALLVSDGRPVSIAYTDSLPVLMIAMKAFGPLSGGLPPFGVAVLVGQILQPVAAAWALRRAGVMHWALLLPGALLVAWMPAWYFRLAAQHLPLTWQWQILLALGLAFGWCRTGRIGRYDSAGAMLLCAASVATHVYLAVDVLALCFVGCLVLLKAGRYISAVGLGIGFISAAAVAALAVGLLPTPDVGISMGRFASPPGYYSFNVLAPFDLSYSALWPTTSPIDATGGQYEGMAYLGAGLLLLLSGWCVVTMARLVRRWRLGSTLERRDAADGGRLWSYWPLILVLLALAGFAVFPDVWLGTHRLLSFPVPSSVVPLLEQVRSGGRMIWPVVYALAITLVTIAGARISPRSAALVLVTALTLQIVDTTALRDRIRLMLTAPPLVPAGLGTLLAQGTLDTDIRLRPSWLCVRPDDTKLASMAALEAIRLGARVYQPPLARAALGDCDPSRIATDPPLLNVTDLIFRGSLPLQTQLTVYARRQCAALPSVLVCKGMRSPGPLSAEEAFSALTPPVAVGLGVRLPVTPGSLAVQWLSSGWSNPEEWGTWSEGPIASLSIPIPKDARVRTVALEATGYSGNPTRTQGIVATISGKTKWQGRLAPGHVSTIRIPIDASDSTSPLVHIDLRIEHPQSPRANNQGTDSRLLGIALRAIVLEGDR